MSSGRFEKRLWLAKTQRRKERRLIAITSIRLGEKNSFFQAIHNSGDAILDHRNIEVDQQTQSPIAEPQAGEMVPLQTTGTGCCLVTGRSLFSNSLAGIASKSRANNLPGYRVLRHQSQYAGLAKVQRTQNGKCAH